MNNKVFVLRQMLANYWVMFMWKLEDILELLRENRQKVIAILFVFLLIALFIFTVRSAAVGGSPNVFFKCDTDMTKQNRSIFCNSARSEFPLANLSYVEQQKVEEKPKHDSSISENGL